MTVDSYTERLRSDAERMAIAFQRGPLDTPVIAYPGWDLGRLAEHMGFIHRWARFAVVNGLAPGSGDIDVDAATDPRPDRTADGSELAGWVRADRTRIDIVGDREVGDEWLSLPGW